MLVQLLSYLIFRNNQQELSMLLMGVILLIVIAAQIYSFPVLC